MAHAFDVTATKNVRTVAVVKTVKFEDARLCSLFKDMLASTSSNDIRFEVIDGDCAKYTPDVVLEQYSRNWLAVARNAGYFAFWAALQPINLLVTAASSGEVAFGGSPDYVSTQKKKSKPVISNQAESGSSDLLIAMFASLPNDGGMDYTISNLPGFAVNVVSDSGNYWYDRSTEVIGTHMSAGGYKSWDEQPVSRGFNLNTTAFKGEMESRLSKIVLLLSNAAIQPSNISVVLDNSNFKIRFNLNVSLAPVLLQMSEIDKMTLQKK